MNNLEISTTPRAGFWLCLGLYVVSFVLPMGLDESFFSGLFLFCIGALYLGISFVLLFCNLFTGHLGEAFAFFLMTVPWLANILLWCGLALYSQGNGRASLGAAIVAVVLAASFLLLQKLGGTAGSLGFYLLSPAYLAWLGSMVLLLIFAARSTWLHSGSSILWHRK